MENLFFNINGIILDLDIEECVYLLVFIQFVYYSVFDIIVDVVGF